MDEQSTIGQRLRELRLWRHMTLAQVAGLAGVTAGYISLIERGLRSPDRRWLISALASALQVSEVELTGGPHLGTDPLQSGPHAAVSALRLSLAVNTLGEPAISTARPLTQVTAALKSLRPAHAAGDYMRLGPALPGILDELYLHASEPRGEDDQVTAARALVDALSWAASMCHVLRYADLAQIASRAAMDAANLISDPVRLAMARFERIGTAPHPSHAAWVQALTLTERAAEALEPHARDATGLQVLGMLTLRCAFAATAALKGDTAGHWLDEAEKLAARVDDTDPYRNWEWFGETNVAIWRTALAVERGESGRGVLQMASRVDPAKLVVASRAQGLYLDVGRGLARDQRTQDEATKWLRRAELAAPQQFRNYGPAREAIGFLLTRARTTAGGRELRGMAARMGVQH